MKSRPTILMLGPCPRSQGGMASVVAVYERSGLFHQWGIEFIPTYREGSAVARLWLGIAAFFTVIFRFATTNVCLVHLHVATKTSFYRKSAFATLCRFTRHPYIFHLHGAEMDSFYNECGPLRRAFIRWVFRKSAIVVALSSGWREWVLSVEPSANVTVVHNPVSIPAGPVQLTHDSARPLQLLFLGRLGQRKGIYDLLQAVSLVRNSTPPFRLVCGGDGELDKVRDRIQELSLESCVELLGWVTGTEKERVMKESAGYILPSYHEGLPMGVLEAMAAGIPVITTRLRGMGDAVDDGNDGLLFDPGNIQQLANLLTQLLKDSELRVRLGKAAHEKAKRKFSDSAIMKVLGEIYAGYGAATPHK